MPTDKTNPDQDKSKGIANAAIKGALQSDAESSTGAVPAPSAQPALFVPEEEPAEVDTDVEEDEDQEWRRAGGAAPKA